MAGSKSRKSNRRSRSNSRTSSSSRRARTENNKKKGNDSNWDKAAFAIGVAVAGRQGSKLVDNWSGFFGEKAAEATNHVNTFVGDLKLWDTLSNAIMKDGSTKPVSEVISAIPGALGENLKKLCPSGNCGKGTIVSNETLGYLAIIGVPLSVYLFVKFRGTDHEKEVLERKLREAKRISDESTESSFEDYSSRKK